PELGARDGDQALRLTRLELPEIEADAADDGLGRQPAGRVASRRFLHGSGDSRGLGATSGSCVLLQATLTAAPGGGQAESRAARGSESGRASVPGEQEDDARASRLPSRRGGGRSLFVGLGPVYPWTSAVGTQDVLSPV